MLFLPRSPWASTPTSYLPVSHRGHLILSHQVLASDDKSGLASSLFQNHQDFCIHENNIHISTHPGDPTCPDPWSPLLPPGRPTYLVPAAPASPASEMCQDDPCWPLFPECSSPDPCLDIPPAVCIFALRVPALMLAPLTPGVVTYTYHA